MSAGMNEAETRLNYIDPDLRSSGWGYLIVILGCALNSQLHLEESKDMEDVAASLIADYVLEYNNRKIAVVEAKKYDLHVSEGVQQAKDYAKRLDVRFTYSTNGQGFYEIDMLTGRKNDRER